MSPCRSLWKSVLLQECSCCVCCRRGEVSQNFVLPVGMKCDVFDVPTQLLLLLCRWELFAQLWEPLNFLVMVNTWPILIRWRKSDNVVNFKVEIRHLVTLCTVAILWRNNTGGTKSSKHVHSPHYKTGKISGETVQSGSDNDKNLIWINIYNKIGFCQT